MKILITGGAGFIGSNLCRELVKNKTYKIFSLDDYSSGLKSRHVKDVTYIIGETKNISTLITFVPDVIYHLGEYSRVVQSMSNPEKIIESNIVGTAKVLEFWRKNKCRLVYSGSSTKFSKDFEEESSPYSVSKKNNTDLIKKYGKWFELDHVISYFYNVYGEGENFSGGYKTFIATVLSNKSKNLTMKIASPGTQKRNFTHIKDTVSGLLLLLKKGKGDGYSFGAKEKYTLIEVAEIMKSDYVLTGSVIGDRHDSICDTSKSEKELGWVQRNKLSDYLEKFA